MADWTFAYLFYALAYEPARILQIFLRNLQRQPALGGWRRAWAIVPEPLGPSVAVAVVLAPVVVLVGPVLVAALGAYVSAPAVVAGPVGEVAEFMGGAFLVVAVGLGLVLGTSQGLREPLPRPI